MLFHSIVFVHFLIDSFLQRFPPGNKPSSPFVAKEKKAMLFEANKPRPGTAEAEIEGKRIIFIVV